MPTVYMLAAAIGGTVLVCQFLLTLLGLGVESIEIDGFDIDHPTDAHHGQGIFGELSFRTLMAFTAFFGLGGLAASAYDLGEAQAFVAALAAGCGAFVGAAWLMAQLTRFDTEGTVHVEDTLEQTGTVYLRIPAGGQGKVQVVVGARLLELAARSNVDRELRNGEAVRVVRLLGADVVEVIPVPATEAAPAPPVESP